MVSLSSSLAKSMVLRTVSRVSPGRPMMKSPWTVRPIFLALAVKRCGHIDGGALLDVFEDLLVAGFVADDQQPEAGVLHGAEGVLVGGDARGAGPGEIERLELLAELDGALLVVEGVVVEEDFLEPGKLSMAQRHFIHDIVGGAQAPAVAGMGLRPQAESAHGRAAAGGVEGDEGVQQEGDVVAA